MVKKLSITILSLVLLASPTFAFAQDLPQTTSSSPNVPATATNIEQNNLNSKKANTSEL